MPGIVTVIIGVFNSIVDLIILMIYLKCILQHRKDGVNNVIYYASFIIVCAIQYGVGWFANLWFVNLLLSLIGIFMLTFLYDNKMMMRIFAPISFQVFAMLSEVLLFTMFELLKKNNLTLAGKDGALYANTFSRLILFLIVIIIANLLKKNTAVLYAKDYLFMLGTPLVSILLIIAITFPFEYGDASVASQISVCFSVMGIMIINFIVYYLLENLITATEIRQKQLRMETQFDYQENKYEQTSQSFKNISGIIHDTNKHLLYLRECIMQRHNEEAIDYINKTMKAMDKSYKRFHTGNLVIDALVSNAANTALLNRISFKTDIRVDKDKINIERYDLCVVLGNLLDNSIEACMEIVNPDDRYINIMITTGETAFIVDVINSAFKKIQIFQGFTSKLDKKRHGYGLQNISMVVEKYGGTFYYNQKEDFFQASVVLPFKEF